MPEGDTIFRTARTLRQALAGKAIRRFEAKRLVDWGPARRLSTSRPAASIC